MSKRICYFCKEEIEGFANTIGDLFKQEGEKRESTFCCDKCYSKVLRHKLNNSELIQKMKDGTVV